jgi:putative MATE family efflux protein
VTEGLLRRTFGRSPYDREIVRLAVPALGALAADPLVSLVDTAYVGRLGTTALGSLAVAAAVFGIAFSVFNFLQYGTTPTIARELARGDGAEAGRIATSAATLAIIMGVLLAAVLVTTPEPLLRTLGAGPDLLAPATTYLRIRALALPSVLLVTVGHGVFRGAQDTRTPFVLALGLNAVNLVLDPILIFGFDMGLAGAAWATVVAQWLGALAFVAVLRRSAPTIGLVFAAPAIREIRSLATAGRDLVLRTLALLVAFTVATGVAARLGAVPVAAHQVAFQLFIFLSLSLDAVAIAAQAMLGKALGDGDTGSLLRKADRLVGVGWLAGLALGAVLLLAMPWLPAWFTTDPEVQQAIRSIYPALVVVQVIGGAVFAWDGIVIGATDFRWAMIATLVPAAIATALLVPVLAVDGTIAMVWWILALMLGMRAALLAWWHRTRLAGRLAV